MTFSTHNGYRDEAGVGVMREIRRVESRHHIPTSILVLTRDVTFPKLLTATLFRLLSSGLERVFSYRVVEGTGRGASEGDTQSPLRSNIARVVSDSLS